MTRTVVARLFQSRPLPWLDPNWAESWLARTSWVSGFFSSRGKPLVLWGGTGVCPPGKKEGGLPEPLTVLVVNPNKNYSPDPWLMVSSNPRVGGATFPQAHLLWGPVVPSAGDTSLGGECQTFVWYAPLGKGQPSRKWGTWIPSKGGALDDVQERPQPWKGKKSKQKKNKERKKSEMNPQNNKINKPLLK